MFKIAPAPTFPAEVKVPVPGQEAPAVLSLTFRHMGRAALKDWAGNAGDKTDATFLDVVIESWRGVVKDDGAPVPYSVDALAALLDAYPAAGAEIFNAYLQELTRGRAKN